MSPKIQFHFLPRNLRMRTGWLVAVLSLGPFTYAGGCGRSIRNW